MSSTRFQAPVPLDVTHETEEFDCGSVMQTDWFARHALQAQRARTARVYAAVFAGSTQVAGFYALAAGQVLRPDATPRLERGTGGHPIPVVVLARFGVDLASQRRGLGANLLSDALRRVMLAADIIGIRALVIHCESEEARDFYMHLTPLMEASPTDPLHLVLLLKDLERAVLSLG